METEKRNDDSTHSGESASRPAAFVRAASYTSEPASVRAYERLQQLLFNSADVLSAFRFVLNTTWNVVAIGEKQPAAKLDHQIQRALKDGVRIELPQDLIVMLLARRQRMTRPGYDWVEGHYRPGKPL